MPAVLGALCERYQEKITLHGDAETPFSTHFSTPPDAVLVSDDLYDGRSFGGSARIKVVVAKDIDPRKGYRAYATSVSGDHSVVLVRFMFMNCAGDPTFSLPDQ